ncbi:MAG: hypothetical protein EOO16_13235 [Chitinophagaceae bacterium]|nr:MAG: hypothetical protein EOO16_13235 [Chitinophagaceae bacterium]
MESGQAGTTNHGELLKEWVKHLGIKPKVLLQRMGYENHEALYHYYNSREIKMSKLSEFAAAFRITLTELLGGPNAQSVEEAPTGYGSKHQGSILEALIEERKTNISHLASYLKKSRPTIYRMMEQQELGPDVIEQLAQYYNVATSYFEGTTSRKSIYQDLEVREQLRLLEKRQNESFAELTTMLNGRFAQVLEKLAVIEKNLSAGANVQ